MACMIQFLITKNPKATRKTGAYFAPDKMLLSQVPDPSQAWANAIQKKLAPLMGKDATESDFIEVNTSSEDGEESASVVADGTALAEAVGDVIGWIVAVFDLAADGFIRIGGVNPAAGVLSPDGRLRENGVPLVQYAGRAPWTARSVHNGNDSKNRIPYKASFENYVKFNAEPLFRFVYG